MEIVNKIQVVKRIDVQSTLLTLSPGEVVTVKTCIIKASTIRSTVRKLNERGYSFTATEKGLIDEIKIIRNK